MKKAILTLLLTVTALNSLAPADAQSSSPPDRPRRKNDPNEFYRAPTTMRGKTVLLPIGSTFEGRIDSTISSEHSKNGTAFNVIMSSPVLVNGTDVVIPAGSKIVGEVVEAVPASRVPHSKYQPKILVRGKLRIQINGLQTPDGVQYPLAASLAGEVSKFHSKRENQLGTNIAYMGSSANFEAVGPGMDKRRYNRPGAPPRVTTRRELLRDPMLGYGDGRPENTLEDNTIRSLVLKKRDYYIYEGSPMTVRLIAPFKMGVTPPGAGVPITPLGEAEVEDSIPPPSIRRGSGPVETASGGGGGEQYETVGGGGGSPRNYAPPAQQPPQQQQPNNGPPSADSF